MKISQSFVAFSEYMKFTNNFFQFLFYKYKPYIANIFRKQKFLFQVEIKKNCDWNCLLGPSNRPNRSSYTRPVDNTP